MEKILEIGTSVSSEERSTTSITNSNITIQLGDANGYLQSKWINTQFKMGILAHGYNLFLYTHTLKEVLIANVSYSSISVDKTKKNLIFPNVPRTCSMPCYPGEEKLYQNAVRLPCCYKCTSCRDNSMSNITNAEKCARCRPDEFTAASDRTQCIPVDVTYVTKGNNDKFIIVTTFNCITLVTILGTVGTVIGNIDRPIIKASDTWYCISMLISFLFGNALCAVAFREPSIVACNIEFIMLIIFITLITNFLFLRALKIFTIFNTATNFQTKSFLFKFVSRKFQTLMLALTMSFNLALATVALRDKGFIYHMIQKEPHTTFFKQCTTNSALILFLPFILPAIQFKVTLILAFKMRTFPHNFKETTNIFTATLITLVTCLTFLTGYAIVDPNTQTLLRAIVYLHTTLAFFTCLFGPKLMVILKRRDVPGEREEVRANVSSFANRRNRTLR